MNIENHQKYTLTALQLYAVTNVKRLREEKSASIFNSLIDNINMLYNEGMILTIDRTLIRYFGILTICLGDTPALNWLGGFKESVSKATKFCRTCEVLKGPNNSIKFDSILTPRNIINHKKRLVQMQKSDLETYNRLSKKYGINYSSSLLKITDFNICKSLLQDPMHVLYEGICHLELKCFLNEVVIKQKIFDLNFLNEKIKFFPFFECDKGDKPNTFDGLDRYKYSQTSGQMSTLFHILPLILGEKLKEDKFYQNFLRMVAIIKITFSFCYDDKTVEDMDMLIRSYLENFAKIYPDVPMTPKMHFLRHFPKQLEEFGPLRLHSTQRFEAKNGLIKSYSYNNFINICKSTSYRQELWMVSRRLDYNWDLNDNFLSKGEDYKNLKTHQIQDKGFSDKYNFDSSLKSNHLRECESVKIIGFLYKLNSYIIISDSIELKKKTVGKIERILLANDNLVFKLLLFDIVEYNKQINCFEIVASEEITYRYYKNIVHKEPQNVITINSNLYIQIRHFYHKLN